MAGPLHPLKRPFREVDGLTWGPTAGPLHPFRADFGGPAAGRSVPFGRTNNMITTNISLIIICVPWLRVGGQEKP